MSNIYSVFIAEDTQQTQTSLGNGYTIVPHDINQTDIRVQNDKNTLGIQRVNVNLYEIQNGFAACFDAGASSLGGNAYIGIVSSASQPSPMSPPNPAQDPSTSPDCLAFKSDGNVYSGGSQVGNVLAWDPTQRNSIGIEGRLDLSGDFFNIRLIVDGTISDTLFQTPQLGIGAAMTYAYIFISPQNGSTWTITSLNYSSPDGYSSILPLTLPPNFAQPFLINSTTIGLNWQDLTPSNSYTYRVTNTDSGRQYDSVDVNNPFAVITGLQPMTKYNISLSINGNDPIDILDSVTTSGLAMNARFTLMPNQPTNILVPITSLDMVATPRNIIVESIQLKHNVSSLPIATYQLQCPDIGFRQYFQYQGQSFEYTSSSPVISIGGEVPIVLNNLTLATPDNLTFLLSYNTTYGQNIQLRAIDLIYFNITFVIFTSELYFYGLN